MVSKCWFIVVLKLSGWKGRIMMTIFFLQKYNFQANSILYQIKDIVKNICWCIAAGKKNNSIETNVANTSNFETEHVSSLPLSKKGVWNGV